MPKKKEAAPLESYVVTWQDGFGAPHRIIRPASKDWTRSSALAFAKEVKGRGGLNIQVERLDAQGKSSVIANYA